MLAWVRKITLPRMLCGTREARHFAPLKENDRCLKCVSLVTGAERNVHYIGAERRAIFLWGLGNGNRPPPRWLGGWVPPLGFGSDRIAGNLDVRKRRPRPAPFRPHAFAPEGEGHA
jgi:hypothetical protein